MSTALYFSGEWSSGYFFPSFGRYGTAGLFYTQISGVSEKSYLLSLFESYRQGVNVAEGPISTETLQLPLLAKIKQI